MSTRANLARIQPGEQEQYLTVNSGFEAAEKLLDSINVRSVAGGANVALSVADAMCATLKLTGALTANIVVTIPSGFEAKLAVWNATSGTFSLTFATAAGGSVGEVVSQGTAIEVVCDGTNIKAVSTSAVQRQSLPAAATDATSTMALTNALRNAMIGLGLAE